MVRSLMYKRRKRRAVSFEPNIAQLDKGGGDSCKGECSAQKDCVLKTRWTLASDGSVTGLSTPPMTKRCQHSLSRLTTSEKFVSLCKLLSESFQSDKILDLSKVNSRMKEGAYEQAPALFLSDIQKVLRKVHVIGTEMVALSRSVSDMSTLYCRELAVPSASDSSDRQKQPNDFFKACRQCGEKSDGSDCLVCDSFDEMSPHENCVVCDKLGALCGANEVGVSTYGEEPNQNEEGIIGCIIENGIQVFKGGKRVCCKVCKSVLENGELFRLCEDDACSHYHHVRCLTNKQLKSFCSRWYCPCCLCRVCLIDKDDDKNVLCDACDHAYHIYCMHPPQKSIPQGKWYCRKCESGIRTISKAKLAYESFEAKKGKKRVKKRKGLHKTGLLI